MAVLGVSALVVGVATVAGRATRRGGPAALLVEAVLLAPAFSIRRLAGAAREVERALGAGRLDEARTLTGRHLVSRDTTALSAPEVTSAAVESVAENLTDSVVAPLLAYAAGGLPAAWAYRTLNTADAMWGYRDARYERFGKRVEGQLVDRGGQPEELVAPDTVVRHDALHLRGAEGERPRLVEERRANGPEALDHTGALHNHTHLRRA
jgi:hypothetical protein